jgi:hypothetical protein
MRAIEAAADSTIDLQEVKMGDQKNITLAIEFEYPTRAGKKNTKDIYNKNIDELSKFLFV